MSTNAKLRKLAEQLPPYPKHDANGNIITTKVVKEGHTILANKPDAKDKDGKPLDPKAKYLVPTPVMVNHFKEMSLLCKAALPKNKAAVVDEYVKKVYAYHNVKVEVKEESTQPQ